MKTRLLVVDDEAEILESLTVNLLACGFDVDTAATGEDALRQAEAGRPDLVLLDLGLPDIDGIEVVRRLRAWTVTPIIILSVRGSERDKVDALDTGADDYLTKPFGIDELLARMRATLRRAYTPPAEQVVTTGAFSMDLLRRELFRGGTAVHLTPTEWDIVEHLVSNPGRLVTQRELLHQVWGPEYGIQTNYLRVYMTTIRKKLEPDPGKPRYFITEPGVGYRFAPDDF